MEAKYINATLEDGSDAVLQALEEIDISSRGTSKINLYGHGKINILEFLDSAQLRKQKE